MDRGEIRIDGLWKSASTLLRLSTPSEQKEQGFFYKEGVGRSRRAGTMILMKAMAELIATTLPSDTEIVDMRFKSVMPKRLFDIYIQRAGWTWSSTPSREVSELRMVEVEIL